MRDLLLNIIRGEILNEILQDQPSLAMASARIQNAVNRKGWEIDDFEVRMEIVKRWNAVFEYDETLDKFIVRI